MQPPAQELVARDLHENLWTFRHIYRGMFHLVSTLDLLVGNISFNRKTCWFSFLFLLSRGRAILVTDA